MGVRRRSAGRAAAGLLAGGLGLAACSSGAETGVPGARRAPEASPTVSASSSTGPAGATITLAFAGDVHFEGAVAGLLDRPGATLGPLGDALRGADLAVVNLESALTTVGRPTAKEREEAGSRYWFRSPPAALDVLARSGVDVATVANNHGADYGAAGLRDTLRTAADAPVAVVGVGDDADAAFTPHRVTVRGTDVAVLAADASPRESGDGIWSAGEGGIGIARAPSPRLLAAVRSADAAGDVVVVYLHWGEEYAGCPTPGQQRLAADLAEAGADVVVGTHAHVLLGSGMLGDTYVGYGLGNFLWYHGVRSETGVLQVRIRDGEVVGDDWVPGRIPPQGGQPVPLTGTARADAVEDWRTLRACTDLAAPPGDRSPDETRLPAYRATVAAIGPDLRRRMVGSSHDPAACPVPLADLRHLRLSYVGFDGRAHTGQLVVAADVAEDVVDVFGRLYAARWPVRRMELVDAYGGDDDRSMAADNTSAYNCRRVAGQESWSDHAYGRAVDLNPVENPYLTGGDVRPPAGRAFATVDRSGAADGGPGVIHEGDVVWRAFTAAGWTWGGSWSEPDYQHFSAPDRQ